MALQLVQATFQRGLETIITGNGVLYGNATWHLDVDRLIPGWFGLPDTNTITEARTGAAGMVIVQNLELGRRVDVVLHAEATTAANAYVALNLANSIFSCTGGVTSTMEVDFPNTGGSERTLTVQREGPMRVKPNTTWSDPRRVVWTFELTLISEAVQGS